MNARDNIEKNLSVHTQKLESYLQNNLQTLAHIKNAKETLSIMGQLNKHETKPSDAFVNLVINQQKKCHFKNIFLITQEGNIVYSLIHKEKQNLLSPVLKKSILTNSFLRAQATLSDDLSEFAYDPETKEPLLFLTAPLFDHGKNIGFLGIHLDHAEIYKIINNFEGLGKTGEIILGKAVNNSVIIASPTRKSKKEAFKTLISTQDEKEIPLILSSQAQAGSGNYVNSVGESIFAVWKFVSKLNLGIVSKKNIEEIKNEYAYLHIFHVIQYVFYVISIASFLIGLYGFCLGAEKNTANSKTFFKFFSSLILLLFLGILGTVGSFLYSKYISMKNLNKNEEQLLSIATEQFEHSLSTLANITHSIGEDLQTGRLKISEIKKRLEIDMQQNSDIVGITVAFQSSKEGAPSYFRNAKEIKYQNLITTLDSHGESLVNLPWYQSAFKKNSQWSDPYFDTSSNSCVVAYSTPFYHSNDLEKPLGVVSIFYPVLAFKQLINRYDVGYSGYYFLNTQHTTQFIVHPLEDNVLKQKTIFDQSQQFEIPNLLKLGNKIKDGQSGYISYNEPDTKNEVWINFRPLKVAQWTLAKICVAKEIVSNILDSKINFLIIFIQILVLLVLISLVSNKKLRVPFLTLVLLIGNFALWFWIDWQEPSLDESEVIIADFSKLNLFIDKYNNKLDLLFEHRPTLITTGFYLHALNVDEGQNKIAFNADLWQDFESTQAETELAGFTLQRAAQLNANLIHLTQEKNKNILLWKTIAELFYNFSRKAYPLDTHVVRISIDPKDVTRNILLIPAIDSYRFTDVTNKPGIAKDITLAGFSLKESFFTYRPTLTNVNFGVESHSKSNTYNNLNFVMVLKRNILNPLVTYILPLFIILLMIFSTVLVANKWLQGSLGALATLFISLLLLHRDLRSTFKDSDIIYMEYFFFSTYFIHFLAVVYAGMHFLQFFVGQSHIDKHKMVASLFWPLNLFLWLLATIYVFFLS